MAKYLYRTCPKCKDYLGVVVPEPLWKVILGNKPILTLLWIVSFILASSIPVYPHGGGLDRYGCHHNRKQGNYHCHRGGFAGQQFSRCYVSLIQVSSWENVRLSTAPLEGL